MSKKSDLTRERLLDAAGRVASREGYGAFTLEAVAAEAGTSKGGLLYHYASKELLIAGMVERMTHKFETARVEAMALDPAPPGAWTRSFVRATCADQEADLVVASCLIAAIVLNPELLAPLRAQYNVWIRALESDGLPVADAHIARLAVDGLWLTTLIGLPVPSPEQQHHIKERLLDFARASEMPTLSAPANEASGQKATSRTLEKS
ncbi:MAG: TetR family transcriptional regulator [Rhodocyclaceae bacterium]|nr:TetR family transcriptional regulator [Rhodocyclaceae bacterium]